MSLLVIVSLIAAFWVYRDAQSFGHTRNSALLWAVGTIMFFLVCFPLYLLLGRKPQVRAEKQVHQSTIDIEADYTDENLRDCPMCGKQVKEEFHNCPYCGYMLDLKCNNCGEPLRREWNVCPFCQTKAPEK